MRTDEWLKSVVASLQLAGIESARLDCLLLLEDATNKDRSWLLAHPEYKLPDSIINDLSTKITRRCDHIPLAYIRGQTEFYGRTFAVDEHVLVPRPETETIVELLKSLPLSEQPTIVDIGTGSGALAVSAKLELPQATVIGLDIDPECLAIAQSNAHSLMTKINFKQADLLTLNDNSADLQSADIILANLPYVPDDYPINKAASHEPTLALFGGPDGLEPYRRMFDQVNIIVSQPAFILTEALPDQHAALAVIAKAHSYTLWAEQDYIQAFRFTGQ